MGIVAARCVLALAALAVLGYAASADAAPPAAGSAGVIVFEVRSRCRGAQQRRVPFIRFLVARLKSLGPGLTLVPLSARLLVVRAPLHPLKSSQLDTSKMPFVNHHHNREPAVV